MTSETLQRAHNMLRTELLGTKSRLLHIPYVYVVGEKIFAAYYAARDWRAQVCPQEKIETVSILQAYGVTSKEDLPRGMWVSWSFGTTIK